MFVNPRPCIHVRVHLGRIAFVQAALENPGAGPRVQPRMALGHCFRLGHRVLRCSLRWAEAGRDTRAPCGCRRRRKGPSCCAGA